MQNLFSTVKLIAIAALVLTVLVFGPVSSQAAEEVIFDQNVAGQAIGIKNLDIGGKLYDVAFTASEMTAAMVYGPFPGTFDFNTADSAGEAADAVNAALTVADAERVGAEGEAPLNLYRIGYDSQTVFFDVPAVVYWRSATEDVAPDVWVRFDSPNPDHYNLGPRLWAVFTLVSGPTAPVTIGGNVTGLEGSGLVLQNNGGDDEPIDGDGTFTFDTALAPGSAYNVTVAVDPSNPDQTCSVANGSGTVPDQAVTNVAVTCAPPDTPAANTAFLPAVYLLLLSTPNNL